MPVESVSLSDLRVETSAEAALHDFTGFVPLLPDEAPAAERGHPVWRRLDGRWQRQPMQSAGRIGPLGMHLLRDVDLCGSGYLFTNESGANPGGLGRFIAEGTHTSDVARGWLDNPHFPDNPFHHPLSHEIVLDSPALVVFGGGFPIYGHWLLDFLPRVVLAQRFLGERFKDVVIPLPSDVPAWLFDMLGFFCGVDRAQVVPFDRTGTRVVCRKLLLPSFAHNGGYALHSFMVDFYRSFIPAQSAPPDRRICLSRRHFETSTRSAWRIFESRRLFEEIAAARGYEIVCPEDLDFRQQIELFAGATAIVGEYGSAMHSAIFSPPLARIGCFPLSNAIQNEIGAACRHHNIYPEPAEYRTDERGVIFYDVARDDLEATFDLIDKLEGRTGLTEAEAA